MKTNKKSKKQLTQAERSQLRNNIMAWTLAVLMIFWTVASVFGIVGFAKSFDGSTVHASAETVSTNDTVSSVSRRVKGIQRVSDDTSATSDSPSFDDVAMDVPFYVKDADGNIIIDTKNDTFTYELPYFSGMVFAGDLGEGYFTFPDRIICTSSASNYLNIKIAHNPQATNALNAPNYDVFNLPFNTVSETYGLLGLHVSNYFKAFNARFYLQAVTTNSNNLPIEHFQTWYAPDVFHFNYFSCSSAPVDGLSLGGVVFRYSIRYKFYPADSSVMAAYAGFTDTLQYYLFIATDIPSHNSANTLITQGGVLANGRYGTIYNVSVAEICSAYVQGYEAGYAYALTGVVQKQYELGYNNGLTAGYQQGYDKGYEEASTLLETQYDNKLSTEKKNSYNIGYADGKSAGIASANEYTFGGLLSSVIDVPVQTFISLFDFEILGVNLSGFFLSLLSVAIILAVVKLII